MMEKILLVEDSHEFQVIVSSVLKSRYTVVCAESVAKMRSEIATATYNLILLDVSLPDGNGFELCSELKRLDAYIDTPILLLTGRTDTSDRVMGWNVGADDYIEKPFNPFEFQARVDAHVRKSRLRSEQSESLVRGGIKLDISFHDAKIVTLQGDRSISLTRNEFRLLYHLVRNQDRVLTRAQLQQAVWGHETHVTDRTIDKHVSSIRQKLETEATCIQTVSGFGYRFSLRKAA